jgi:hypothetical protein
MSAQINAVQTVLEEFFMFDMENDCWFHKRCDKAIADYQAKAERNREVGKLGGRPKSNPSANPQETQVVSKDNPNQEPITNNHKPSGEATRISEDWFLSKALGEWASKERPDLDIRKEAEQFKDFWLGQTDDKGYRKDWSAVWRHWIRGCHVAKQNPADIVRLTVPSKNEPDPALEKIKADEKKAAPMPDFVRQFAKQVKGGV